MSEVHIYNEDCIEMMKNHLEAEGKKVNIVLTSPPYNTGRPTTSDWGRKNYEGRYDIHMDTMSAVEYCDWCVNIFNQFNKILEKDGVVLWNVSYGNDTTMNPESLGLMWLSIADIIRQTDFIVADRIIWKKKSALPNNASANKLTRIVEDVFVFCRKSEINTFKANKGVASVSNVGQKFYENIMNFIEAANNDGSTDLNKATYSTELCKKLLAIYATKDMTVYDPFMGTGTTAVACKQMGLDCYGSELSPDQCKYALERLGETQEDNHEKYKATKLW